MSTIYAVGTSNDDLIDGLCSADPAERMKCAEAIGVFRLYLALPHLLEMARSEVDPQVFEAARDAVVALLSSEEAADHAIAGDACGGRAGELASQQEHAAVVIGLFKRYVADRATPGAGVGQDDLADPVRDYLAAWGGRGSRQLDEVGLAAATAIGAISSLSSRFPTRVRVRSTRAFGMRGRELPSTTRCRAGERRSQSRMIARSRPRARHRAVGAAVLTIRTYVLS